MGNQTWGDLHVCNVLPGLSIERTKERTMFTALKINTAAGYQGPVQKKRAFKRCRSTVKHTSWWVKKQKKIFLTSNSGLRSLSLEKIAPFTGVHSKETWQASIPVIIGLEWAILVYPKVFGLFLCKLSQVAIKCWQVQHCYIFIWNCNLWNWIPTADNSIWTCFTNSKFMWQ